MTIAVTITVGPLEDKTAVLYQTAGNNKKREPLHTFTKAEPTWVGHIWNGRDLVIEEVSTVVEEPTPEPQG